MNTPIHKCSVPDDGLSIMIIDWNYQEIDYSIRIMYSCESVEGICECYLQNNQETWLIRNCISTSSLSSFLKIVSKWEHLTWPPNKFDR